MSDEIGFKWDDHIEREVNKENEAHECSCGVDDEDDCTCGEEPDYESNTANACRECLKKALDT